MSEKAIKCFIDICNNKGLAEGFKIIVISNLIKEPKLARKFYEIYFQLNTKRKKHDDFNEELNECLQSIGCKLDGNLVYREVINNG